MATFGYVEIYSNDGATLLFTSTNSYSSIDDMTITEAGVTFTDGVFSDVYTYSGQKKFLGLATSSNAIEAGFPVGYSGAIGSFTFYIVEGGEEQPEQPETTPTKKFTRLYIGDTVASSGGRVWKKLSAEAQDELAGTWVFNNSLSGAIDSNVNFESVDGNWTRIQYI